MLRRDRYDSSEAHIFLERKIYDNPQAKRGETQYIACKICRCTNFTFRGVPGFKGVQVFCSECETLQNRVPVRLEC